MIVYLASYPRSGNSLLRDIIHEYFKFPTTNVYPGNPHYPVRFRYAENWRVGDAIALRDKRRFWLVWNKWIALYDRNVPPFTKNARFLLVGCLKSLTPRNRQRLAAEENIFFVKTHERPYASYFKGEYVIQPHRHPGPLFRSYANLEREDAEQAHDLHYYIQGAVHVGSWSDYHTDWTAAMPQLGERMMRLDYESMLAEPLTVVHWVHKQLNLPYDPEARLRPFAGRHMYNPHMFGFGSNAEWEKAYNPDQLRALWHRHQAVMQYFGYAEPDYSAAKEA